MARSCARCSRSRPRRGAVLYRAWAASHACVFFNKQTSISHRRLRPRSRCCPEEVMYDDLRRDYVAMATMIFSTPPRFEDVIESVAALEARLNSSSVVE